MIRNVGSNWLVTIATIVVTFGLTPFTIHTLGKEGYGAWTLIASLTGYLGLLILGVPMASVRYFSQHVAEGDVKQLNRSVASCTGMYLALGFVALLAGAVVYLFFRTYDITPALRLDADLAYALAVLYIALGFVGVLPEGILAALDAFVPRNIVRLGSLVLRVVLTVSFLVWWPVPIVLAIVQLACLVFDFAVSWSIIRRREPGIRFGIADFDWGTVRRIFGFSLYVLLLNMGVRLTFQTDALVIGHYLDVASIPLYTVANSFIVYLMDFLIAIGAVVMPTATRLKTQGREGELVQIFLKWSKIAFSITLVVGTFLLTLGPRFIGWWIDPSFELPAGQVLQILMASSLIFLPVRGVALPVLMGLGQPRVPTIAFLASGVLNLILSIVLVRPFGLAGVALGTAIPNIALAGFLLVRACRELHIDLGQYLRYVLPRPLIGAIPSFALLWWLRSAVEIRGIIGLMMSGVVLVALSTVIWVLWVYRKDPYLDLQERLRSLRRARA